MLKVSFVGLYFTFKKSDTKRNIVQNMLCGYGVFTFIKPLAQEFVQRAYSWMPGKSFSGARLRRLSFKLWLISNEKTIFQKSANYSSLLKRCKHIHYAAEDLLFSYQRRCCPPQIPRWVKSWVYEKARSTFIYFPSENNWKKWKWHCLPCKV